MVPEIEVETSEIPDNDAINFVKDMKTGWNLGNTLDAYQDSYSGDDLNIESSWCDIRTSEAMIDAVKDAGFQTIRIPVTWHNHLENGYQIKAAWADRVQEVVDYAIDKGMYVIINIQHDIDRDYIYPDMEILDQSLEFMETIWQQIAARYGDYDDHLIFDSLNECRLKDTEDEWYNNISDDEAAGTLNENMKAALDCINRLNQKFVDTVRAAGGNNATRYLMIEGYDGSADGVLNEDFVMPVDVNEGTSKLLASVHAYIPYNFALQPPAENGSVSEFDYTNTRSTADIDTMMQKLYDKYISRGTAVVIGEFGARQKADNLQSRVDFTAYYVAAARAKGMSCLWWDNNMFEGTGENFGLMDRKTITWIMPEIVEAMMKYSK
ncbi:glycoside hydrolase family 5 protein [Robinsoniella peoriensis]|uniref:glycoside hydrolase family 5 protein n=1 Tax=Robinsoniella peoriensis TaxID=180332 RepID=UPI00085C6537|nr:glycoside hydrolase family 5 protein [Robinsoniella peoriensis]